MTGRGAKWKFSWMQLWEEIHSNTELANLEVEGFHRGALKGKTMDVPDSAIKKSLDKQYTDFLKAWFDNDNRSIREALADLRNVAGCLFLKLDGEG